MEKIVTYIDKGETNVRQFVSSFEDEVIYVIKTIDDFYIVVHSDAYLKSTGETFVGNKEEIELKYKILI